MCAEAHIFFVDIFGKKTQKFQIYYGVEILNFRANKVIVS